MMPSAWSIGSLSTYSAHDDACSVPSKPALRNAGMAARHSASWAAGMSMPSGFVDRIVAANVVQSVVSS